MNKINEYTIVHYGELRLKGRNRISFENRLINNIKKICGGSVEKLGSSLLCKNSDPSKFKYVSGISSYAQCIKLEKDYENLIKHFEHLNFSIFNNKKSFAVKVKRSDKKFKYNSVQLGETIGSLIYDKTGISVNLKTPDITVYIEINEYILIYYDKYVGIGGFPAGIHGNILCLLSGGIDSPLAAFEMIKKGCRVDLIHFHTFKDNNIDDTSKIFKIAKVLNNYQLSTKLYLIPSYYFDIKVFSNSEIIGYEMVLFRKFIVKIAEYLCKKHNYKAIVSGDSLGQVASQTLENLHAVYCDTKLPVLQPLIAYDKQEIIDKSKKIGTYEISIEPYKDCCSIISKRPVTKANHDKVSKLEVLINMNKLIEDTLSDVSLYDVS